ncbi:protein phosphatase 2C domain-containing protein [Streptomyces sp. INA 01156]
MRDGDEFAAFTPAVLLDGAQVGRLTVRAASMRGDSHNWEGSCRQDAMVVTRVGPPEADFLLLAIADGVGSAKYSHTGSHLVVRQAALHLDQEAESIHAALTTQDEGELRGLANKAIARAVTELSAGQDYATTLHVLLVPTDARIRERVVFSVGTAVCSRCGRAGGNRAIRWTTEVSWTLVPRLFRTPIAASRPNCCVPNRAKSFSWAPTASPTRSPRRTRVRPAPRERVGRA